MPARIAEECLFYVDAQGFTINKKFHARELYCTNNIVSLGLEFRVDVSKKEIDSLSAFDRRTLSIQTFSVHGLELNPKWFYEVDERNISWPNAVRGVDDLGNKNCYTGSEAHGQPVKSNEELLNAALLPSSSLGSICRKLYDLFTATYSKGGCPVYFAVKNCALRSELRKVNIPHIIDLDLEKYGVPSVKHLENRYHYYQFTCGLHVGRENRCSFSKVLMLQRYVQEVKLFELYTLQSQSESCTWEDSLTFSTIRLFLQRGSVQSLTRSLVTPAKKQFSKESAVAERPCTPVPHGISNIPLCPCRCCPASIYRPVPLYPLDKWINELPINVNENKDDKSAAELLNSWQLDDVQDGNCQNNPVNKSEKNGTWYVRNTLSRSVSEKSRKSSGEKQQYCASDNDASIDETFDCYQNDTAYIPKTTSTATNTSEPAFAAISGRGRGLLLQKIQRLRRPKDTSEKSASTQPQIAKL